MVAPGERSEPGEKGNPAAPPSKWFNPERVERPIVLSDQVFFIKFNSRFTQKLFIFFHKG